MKTQLLLTFTSTLTLEDTLEDIQEVYNIVFGNIFVLQDADDGANFFCTYNVDAGHIPDVVPDKTISIHRKKHTNTLYTINALNEIIMGLTHGHLDKTFEIDWSQYKNTILVTNITGVKIIPTKLFDIVKIKLDK